MTNLAPVALFVYGRPEHTRRTVEALQRNLLAPQTDLTIFSDAPKNAAAETAVKIVREYIRTIDGFRSLTIVDRDRNFGLAASILDGVTRICEERGRVIVLEDDLITAPHFLTYMNDALEFYAFDDRVIAVHGYMYPITSALPGTFFLRDPGCWGWATWKRGWGLLNTDGPAQLAAVRAQGRETEFNLDGSYDYMKMLEERIAGKNQSWAVLWYATAFLADKLTLYPGHSLVQNIGFDGSGTHGDSINSFAVALHQHPVKVSAVPVKEDQLVREGLVAFLKKLHHPQSLRAYIRHSLHRLFGL